MNPANLSISVCENGHVSLQMGVTTVHLYMDELRYLVRTGQEVLTDYERRFENFPKTYLQFLSH